MGIKKKRKNNYLKLRKRNYINNRIFKGHLKCMDGAKKTLSILKLNRMIIFKRIMKK
jgi:hypothetical protein